MVPQRLLMRFRNRCCRVGQAAAVGSDQEIYAIGGDQLFCQVLDIGTSAVIIISNDLECNRVTELWEEKSPLRVRLVNPQTQPLERLLSLQRIHTGLRQRGTNGKSGH